MLPDLRLVFGALITLALMGMVAVGLFVSARLTLQAKVGPLEASRTSVFTDSIEWNQFYDAGAVRRFVGLASRSEARETADVPPEHRTEPLTGAPPAIAVTPRDLPAADPLAAPEAAMASTVADAAADVTIPIHGPTTIATHAGSEPIRESPVPERAAIENTEAAPNLKPRPDETVIAHTLAITLPGTSSQSEERPPTVIPFSEAQQDRTAAVAVETEKGSEQETLETTSALDDGPKTARRATEGHMAMPPKPAAEMAVPLPKPQPVTAPPPPTTAPHPAASLARAAAPRPAGRRTTTLKHAQPAIIEPARPRAVSPPRPRAIASRPRPAPQAYAPQPNAPPQPPPGQPVFGPYFPYATPQPGSVRFGPHFGQQAPDQRSRQTTPRARAAQYPAPSAFDPRQFAPQPRPPALPQLGYGPAYGSR